MSKPDQVRDNTLNSRGYGVIPKVVMQDKRLTTVAKSIYSYFCTYAGSGFSAFPSVKKICFDLGISKCTYHKHMKYLIAFGYISVTQVKNSNGCFSHNIYKLEQYPEQKENNVLISKLLKDVENARHLPCTNLPYTENQRTNIPTTEIKYHKNNNKKNNKLLKESVNQSVDSQSVKNITKSNFNELHTEDKRSSEVEVIIKNCDLYNSYSKELADSIAMAIQNLYFDEDFARDNLKLPLDIVRSRLTRLDSNIIHFALNNMSRAVSYGAQILKPTGYLQSCIFNSICDYSTSLLTDQYLAQQFVDINLIKGEDKHE